MESGWGNRPSVPAIVGTCDLLVWWETGTVAERAGLQFIPPLPQADLASCFSDLPYGWEQETDENGQVFFVE